MQSGMRLLAIVVALALMGPAQAQEFPSRPITLVVPLGAGGSMDIMARTIGAQLADRLGKPVVIENRTGGGTIVAAVTVAKSPPDGHTLLVAPSGTMTTNVTLYKKLPYDPKEFVPVALYCKVPFVLVANPALPITSIAALVKYAKANPDQLSFGSTGVGTAPHLAGELLKVKLGIHMTHNPYKGMVQALTDVVAGHTQIAFGDFAVSRSLIADGKLRTLGVSSLTRVPLAPDIPTLAEAGVPGFEAVSWHLIVAPAETPMNIVARLHTELKEVVATPVVQKQLFDLALIPIDTPSVDELRRFVEMETVNWGRLAQQVGIAGSE